MTLAEVKTTLENGPYPMEKHPYETVIGMSVDSYGSDRHAYWSGDVGAETILIRIHFHKTSQLVVYKQMHRLKRTWPMGDPIPCDKIPD